MATPLPRPSSYTGRFAPSPTGKLHLGSLVTALASYLDARHHGGRWLLRIDDLDPLREQSGATAHIMQTLRHHGLHWDGDVLQQSTRNAAYEAALKQLRAGRHLFPCTCSRQMLRESGPTHPHACQKQSAPPASQPFTWRLRMSEEEITFLDYIRGRQRWQPHQGAKDFMVWRRDGSAAYHLATVVDDAFQGVSCVVRGSDLLEAVPVHIWLQQCLNLPALEYAHVPLVTTPEGSKFSKRDRRPPLREEYPAANIRSALHILGQGSPPEKLGKVEEVLAWAVARWHLQAVPQAAI